MAKRSRKKPEKVDVRKVHRELYRASRDVRQIKIGRGTYLAVDGVGEPGGSLFQEAVGRLFAVAYAAKFALKAAGVADFAVPAFECLWFDDPGGTPRDQWRWRLLVRIPDEVAPFPAGPEVVGRSEAARQLHRQAHRLDRGAGPPDAARGTVRRGGRRGPKTRGSGPRVRGFACAGPGHDVYLSDPRRTAPEKLRTIVRMGVRRAVKR